MKLIAVLATLLVTAFAAPSAELADPRGLDLPAGWTPIASAEVRRRMSSSAADEKDVLRKRTPGHVYLCTGSNWQHTCAVVDFGTDGNCVRIPSPYYEALGSIGPDSGALCRLTAWGSSTGCTPHGDLQVQNPGYDNLYSYDGQDYGHSAHFLECVECTNCT